MNRKLSAPISAMTRQEIADLYSVSRKTLKKRLTKHGVILPSGLVYPKDIELIFSLLGMPRQLLA